MLARYSLGDDKAADAIERAVAATLADGPRTRDLDPQTGVSTSTVTDAIVAQLLVSSRA